MVDNTTNRKVLDTSYNITWDATKVAIESGLRATVKEATEGMTWHVTLNAVHVVTRDSFFNAISDAQRLLNE